MHMLTYTIFLTSQLAHNCSLLAPERLSEKRNDGGLRRKYLLGPEVLGPGSPTIIS
jgi:hypothetical protein